MYMYMYIYYVETSLLSHESPSVDKSFCVQIIELILYLGNRQPPAESFSEQLPRIPWMQACPIENIKYSYSRKLHFSFLFKIFLLWK